jgi:PAS domain S-box-containing protein
LVIIQMAFRQYKLAEALRVLGERERRLTAALKCVGDAVITTDAEGRATFINATGVALTGRSPTDAMGRKLAKVFRIIDGPQGIAIERAAATALQEGTVSSATNQTLVDNEGAPMLIDYYIVPIKDSDGNPVGLVVAFRQISGPN